MPILNQRRVREFIRFLQWVFFDSLPAAASQKGILWGHPTPRQRAAALCTPITNVLLSRDTMVELYVR